MAKKTLLNPWSDLRLFICVAAPSRDGISPEGHVTERINTSQNLFSHTHSHNSQKLIGIFSNSNQMGEHGVKWGNMGSTGGTWGSLAATPLHNHFPH